MSRQTINQRGFSAFELILLVAVLGIIAVVGLRFMNAHSKTQAAATKAASVSASTTTATAPAVNSSSDLTKAATTLDQNDPTTANTSDSGALDAQLATN